MKLSFLLLIALLITACSTSPTGRRQLNFVDDKQMAEMGDKSFEALKKKTPPARNDVQFRRIRCITDRLLLAMNEDPKKWEVEIFNDKSPNAFALPGNNMGIHTGMIDLAENNAQLAAVIGHEIGHVLANHGNERVSQAMAAQVGMGVAGAALGANTVKDQAVLAALGLGVQFGVLQPFSRKHETEADELGLKFMAKAGFNPNEAAELWKIMGKKSGNGPPEFLSTHPSPKTRIKNLSKLAKDHMSTYRAADKKPICK